MVNELLLYPRNVDLVWLVPALPLAGAVILLLFGQRLRRIAGGLASFLVGASFVIGVMVFQGLLSVPEGFGGRALVVHVFEWISVGSFQAPVDLRVDPLSMVMVLTVTGVGFLIHVYSMDYMHDDDRYPRYFAYLNLFVAAMLTLVLADNFVLMFVGWEGVGLCSYLLIAFWYERKTAADAGKKAFIVTRIGDTGMLIGIFLIFATFGSVEFGGVFGAAEGMPEATATLIALLLFAGAIGKSAQLPLHTWLPDAMEGPTPVSALIHAATMVTAGVYLVARTHVFFEISGIALGVVAIVGLVTAVYAGLAALAQDDLKRVLAYSTISQLGYMFVALGGSEDLVEPHRAERGEDQEYPDQHRGVADAGDDERLLPGIGGYLPLVPERDEEVRAQADPLPPDVKEGQVVGQDQQEHGRHEQVEVREVPRVPRIAAHVPDRVHVDQAPHPGYGQDHHHRQRINPELHGGPEAPHLDPVEQRPDHHPLLRPEPQEVDERQQPDHERRPYQHGRQLPGDRTEGPPRPQQDKRSRQRKSRHHPHQVDHGVTIGGG